MASRDLIIIYRFDSPCGRYCYVGQTRNLANRINQHRSGNRNSAIFRHCSECGECNRERQTEASWKQYFRKIDDAIEDNQADDLEQHYIDKYCEAYILNFRKPFPLNLRAEAGNGFTQRAARDIYKLHAALAEEKTRTGSLRAKLESAEQGRDSLRQERDKFRKDWKTIGSKLRSALRERNRLRKKNDALTSKLSELQEEHQDLQERLKDTEQEPARLRDENDSLASKLSELQQAHHYSQERLENTEQESARLRNQNEVLARKLEEGRERKLDLKDRLAGVERERREQERKLDDADAKHKRELRDRNLTIALLLMTAAVAAVFLFFKDDSTPATAPMSARIITAPPRPSARPTVTQTPRPTVTPRPTSTSAPTHTPSSTAPQQFVVLEALGANARACPRMDCEVLTKLARDSQVTVRDEVQGEAYRDSALWYRIALPDGRDDAFVHSSLLGPPDG